LRRTYLFVFALVGMTSPGKQATGDLTRGYSKASRINRKEIATEVGDNIELQTLVLGWIKDYKQQAALAGGRSVAELVGNRHQAHKDVAARRAAKKKKKEAQGDGEEESSEGEPRRVQVQPEDLVLRRGQLVFSNWCKKLCLEVMAYVDTGVDMTSLLQLSQMVLHQIMEYIFDLRLHGSAKDKVGTPQKNPTL
jgi:hypothetical protein